METVETPCAEYLLAGSPQSVTTARTTARQSPRDAVIDETAPVLRLPSPFSPNRAQSPASAVQTQTATQSSRAATKAAEGDALLGDMVDVVVGEAHSVTGVGLSGIIEDDSDDDAERASKRASTPATAAAEEEPYRHVHINDPDANAQLGYCCNKVITSRFTIYNFLPKLLFYEFSKLANAYFLIISIMQTIKPISNTNGFPASLPALVVIVVIDMFFACLEDVKRHKADAIANSLPCLVYARETKSFQPSRWNALCVGDIVKVHNREPVPADLVILAACEPDLAHPAGICYVETKSLDGETNLKLRQGLEATYPTTLCDEHVADLQGVVICEQPNNAIHRFSGSITLANGRKDVITANAICLRGSTLRNTEYIYGLVVNTGPDTKIMMASSESPIKWSNMEKRLNQQILYICVLMIVLCLTGATLSTIWNGHNLSKNPHRRAWYLHDKHATAVRTPVGNFFIQVLYYFLLLNSFIPVSLYVSMTSVKFLQAYFMNNDLEMYHEESDTPCQVRTMSLNEELGQIDYIFSDKTGTLTCNIMEFRKCSINGIAYGLGETEVGLAAKQRRRAEGLKHADSTAMLEEQEDDSSQGAKPACQQRCVQAPFVNFQDDSLFQALSQRGDQAEHIDSFFEHLAVCHTVMPERSSDGTLRLSASSPDEQALVAAAGCFGFKFTARAPGKALVKRFSCVEESGPEQSSSSSTSEYQVLEVLEFNSTRKRMSVVLRGPQGDLRLLCKGADTVIYERLQPTQDPAILQVRDQTLKHMEMFASEGLRTLVIAETGIDPIFFESWITRYRAAINDMKQIELRRLGEPNAIDQCMEEIEVNLQVLGCTAIEDRLQNGVPDTIHRLRQASIKIWVLTGDKEETAINIGFACRLLTPDLERIVISADTHPDLITIMDELERYASLNDDLPVLKSNHDLNSNIENGDLTASSTSRHRGNDLSSRRRLTRLESMAMTSQSHGLALVIDGETLELALEECPQLLLKVAQKCQAVIACRVSPAQKAQLVRLVRDNDPKIRTLAIGDGANDVSMIQAAHVGVGISGQEGMQAANSSDYAIAQFRFLSRLLLVHGRWNYIRMGQLILYIFYKNVMMNLTQYWYMLFTGFSGQKFFLEWGLQGYNLIFTAVPIVLISTLEQDVPAYYAERFPILYRVGQENCHFNTKIVWGWITSCVWESLVISFGTIFGLRNLVRSGETPQMWVYGCVAFTIVLLVVTLKLSLHQRMWWPMHFAVYIVSFSLWLATAALLSCGAVSKTLYWGGVFTTAVSAKVFWLLVPLLVFTALSRDFLWKGYQRAFHPSYKHLAQEVHAFGMQRMADRLLAFPPPEEIPRDYDIEAPCGPVESISEDLGATKKALLPSRVPLLTASMSRKSIARGSAFSYDAESLMVESFMATERYHNDGSETRPVFERHASRGSMAFKSMDSDDLQAYVDPDMRSSLLQSTQDLRSSAGNIFRGARHSQGRRRFYSVASPMTVALASTTLALSTVAGYRWRVRRSHSGAGTEQSTRRTALESREAASSVDENGRYTMDEEWQQRLSGTPRLTPIVRRYANSSSLEAERQTAL